MSAISRDANLESSFPSYRHVGLLSFVGALINGIIELEVSARVNNLLQLCIGHGAVAAGHENILDGSLLTAFERLAMGLAPLGELSLL